MGSYEQLLSIWKRKMMEVHKAGEGYKKIAKRFRVVFSSVQNLPASRSGVRSRRLSALTDQAEGAAHTICVIAPADLNSQIAETPGRWSGAGKMERRPAVERGQIVALNKTKERMRPYHISHEDEDPDIKKIKKVQSFMRGWLCRRKWKTIVQDYICSPHAESMRKRNQIVFNMVEAEAEYVHQLYVLVNCFSPTLEDGCKLQETTH
ncbi:unnamed protein product [Ranitomeya imitator]|uniref:Uncharacterized protein n=1 Tax=Ranitomeya imitator TaxID=111125 RepID=A0ABN9LLR2_9NEOB|nr:unnamed protein product [Ranitomeya imitator]